LWVVNAEEIDVTKQLCLTLGRFRDAKHPGANPAQHQIDRATRVINGEEVINRGAEIELMSILCAVLDSFIGSRPDHPARGIFELAVKVIDKAEGIDSGFRLS
jgi:hypothetical protein